MPDQLFGSLGLAFVLFEFFFFFFAQYQINYSKNQQERRRVLFNNLCVSVISLDITK